MTKHKGKCRYSRSIFYSASYRRSRKWIIIKRCYSWKVSTKPRSTRQIKTTREACRSQSLTLDKPHRARWTRPETPHQKELSAAILPALPPNPPRSSAPVQPSSRDRRRLPNLARLSGDLPSKNPAHRAGCLFERMSRRGGDTCKDLVHTSQLRFVRRKI